MTAFSGRAGQQNLGGKDGAKSSWSERASGRDWYLIILLTISIAPLMNDQIFMINNSFLNRLLLRNWFSWISPSKLWLSEMSPTIGKSWNLPALWLSWKSSSDTRFTFSNSSVLVVRHCRYDYHKAILVLTRHLTYFMQKLIW